MSITRSADFMDRHYLLPQIIYAFKIVFRYFADKFFTKLISLKKYCLKSDLQKISLPVHRHWYHLTVAFFIFFAINGCIEPYYPEIKEYQDLLVVDAMITD